MSSLSIESMKIDKFLQRLLASKKIINDFGERNGKKLDNFF